MVVMYLVVNEAPLAMAVLEAEDGIVQVEAVVGEEGPVDHHVTAALNAVNVEVVLCEKTHTGMFTFYHCEV